MSPSANIPPEHVLDAPAGLPCPNSSASFWHSEPSPFLLGHRTTKDLPEYADVVIIGSGITGASAARFLAEDVRASNLNVVMLDAREACWGATGRNGGHCQPLILASSTDIGKFEVKNVATVRDYIEKHEVPCEWRTVTACMTFWNEKHFKIAEDRVKKLKTTDTDLGDMIKTVSDAESFKQHMIKASAKGATVTQGAGCLWPYKYVTFIIEKLVKEGRLNLQTNTPVTNITASSEGHESIQVLDTPRGKLRARNVILATNGYTSSLLKHFTPLIVPVRCEMSALHPPKNSTRLPSSYGLVRGLKGHNPDWDDYLIQRPFEDSRNGDGKVRGGHLMFGGGRGFAEYNCVGETDDDIVDQGEATYLRRALLDTMDFDGEVDGLEELKASHQWTGIKGFSRDSAPWVGKVPEQEGLWLSAGYSGHGMPNASLCAKAVVEMMLGELGGANCNDICRRLVGSGDLPLSYVLTKERIQNAMSNQSVAIQDAAGFLTEENEVKVSEGKEIEQKATSSKCSLM